MRRNGLSASIRKSQVVNSYCLKVSDVATWPGTTYFSNSYPTIFCYRMRWSFHFLAKIAYTRIYVYSLTYFSPTYCNSILLNSFRHILRICLSEPFFSSVAHILLARDSQVRVLGSIGENTAALKKSRVENQDIGHKIFLPSFNTLNYISCPRVHICVGFSAVM